MRGVESTGCRIGRNAIRWNTDDLKSTKIAEVVVVEPMIRLSFGNALRTVHNTLKYSGLSAGHKTIRGPLNRNGSSRGLVA